MAPMTCVPCLGIQRLCETFTFSRSQRNALYATLLDIASAQIVLCFLKCLFKGVGAVDIE